MAVVVGAIVIAMLGVFVLAVDLAAHDTWLMAGTGTARVGQVVRLSLTSGDAFPNDDFAIATTRVVRAVARLRDATQALPRPSLTPTALHFDWTPTRAGVGTLGVELAPKTLTLAPDKIEEYLGEIDATPSTRAAWKAVEGKRKWVESYAKHAVTYVRVGDADDSTWRRPLGFSLEIVPERDPTRIRPGDTLIVRVLRRGAPMRAFAVGAMREGATTARFVRTDSLGRARIVFEASGRWLLNGTDLRRSSRPDFVWESDFVTTTLYVAPR